LKKSAVFLMIVGALISPVFDRLYASIELFYNQYPSETIVFLGFIANLTLMLLGYLDLDQKIKKIAS